MTKPAIGFIGLGLMGGAMVERLQSLGYAMTVVANRSRAPIDAAVARGRRRRRPRASSRRRATSSCCASTRPPPSRPACTGPTA